MVWYSNNTVGYGLGAWGKEVMKKGEKEGG